MQVDITINGKPVRGDVETTINRSPGTMFQEYGSGSYSNLYNLQIVNKTNTEIDIDLKLISPEGEIILMGDSIKAEKGELTKRDFLIVIKKEKIKSSNNHLEIGIIEKGKQIDQIRTTFVGPNSLDSKK